MIVWNRNWQINDADGAFPSLYRGERVDVVLELEAGQMNPSEPPPHKCLVPLAATRFDRNEDHLITIPRPRMELFRI